jgi:hypothetical protein
MMFDTSLVPECPSYHARTDQLHVYVSAYTLVGRRDMNHE